MPFIEISPGELVDRLAILEIKEERFKDPAKLKSVAATKSRLLEAMEETFADYQRVSIWPLYERLKAVNAVMWDAEEDARWVLAGVSLSDASTTEELGAAARALHDGNDERFKLKRQIDALMGWREPEEKSYF